jgi:hypothetical protein
MTLTRNVPLKPGAWLTRTPFPLRPAGLPGTPWPRTVPGIITTQPCITGSRAGNSPAAERRVSPKVKNAAKGNSGPTPKVRRLVLERDGYACFCCGQSIRGQRYSLGHRLRASQGGKAVPSNLITLLGAGGEQHHGRIDQRRDPADEQRGYTVRSNRDPAKVPVSVLREDGSRVSRYLWDDGTCRDDQQPEAVAA